MTLFRALLFLFLIVMVPRVVHACGCYSRATVLEDFERADFVIIAKLKSATKAAKPTPYGSYVRDVTMAVQQVFKGDFAVGQELTFGQGDPVLGCTWDFFENDVGEEYLLYLYRPEKASDPFYVSTCNRSRSLAAAADDLLYLNNIDKARGRTRVSGVIDADGGDGVAGLQIRVRGHNKTYVATTDTNGVYELYDLPPGRYSLEPVLRPGWKVEEYRLTREPTRAELMSSDSDRPAPNKVWFTLRAKKHFGVNVDLAFSSKVTGRVTTSAGQPLEKVCVSLVGTDSSPSACHDFTNADGSFAIADISAGSYYLLLNYENVRSSKQPFATLYYPNAPSPAAARVFTVNFGDNFENLNFVVPNMDETITFQGIVRYANGRPARDRYVRFITPKTATVDGSTETQADKEGRFSLTVLKGLRGELYSYYNPDQWEYKNCPRLQKLLEKSGQSYVILETPRLNVVATENRTFELKLPESPCR